MVEPRREAFLGGSFHGRSVRRGREVENRTSYRARTVKSSNASTAGITGTGFGTAWEAVYAGEDPVENNKRWRRIYYGCVRIWLVLVQ